MRNYSQLTPDWDEGHAALCSPTVGAKAAWRLGVDVASGMRLKTENITSPIFLFTVITTP
jgi:hypothetical protein